MGVGEGGGRPEGEAETAGVSSVRKGMSDGEAVEAGEVGISG